MDSGTLIDNIRKSVNKAAEAWAADKSALTKAVREANNRTGEVLALREQLQAMRAVGERQVAEIAALKAQPILMQPLIDRCKVLERQIQTALGTPQPTDVATSGPDAEAKAAGARMVYMGTTIPGLPGPSFDKLKPICREGWHAVVAFVEHSLLVENGVLRDRLAARDAALRDAVGTLTRAGYEYNPEAMVPWKPPVNVAATKLHAMDHHPIDEMAAAAQKHTGRRMPPNWWVDTVAGIRAWVLGEAPLNQWGAEEEDDWDGDFDYEEDEEEAPTKRGRVPKPQPIAETSPKPDIIGDHLAQATKEVATKIAGIVNDLRTGMENKRKEDDFDED